MSAATTGSGRYRCISCRERWTDGGLQCSECLSSARGDAVRIRAEDSQGTSQNGTPATEPVAAASRAALLTFPWDMLASDNLKRSPLAGREKWRTYRDRRDAMHLDAKRQWAARPRFSGALVLVAMVYPPDGRRYDPANFAKATHDALTGAVYDDDAQLARTTWARGPIDPERPRVEITLMPLAPT